MTKRKTGAAAIAAREEGAVLHAAIAKQLEVGGLQTAVQLHAAIGGDIEVVRNCLYRMNKAGVARSVRGVDRAPSQYCLGQQTMIIRNVGLPYRPVLKEWTPNHMRDTLHCLLFGVPDVLRVAA
jgi:hypothetical protein